MKIHELSTLNFSDALEMMEERIVAQQSATMEAQKANKPSTLNPSNDESQLKAEQLLTRKSYDMAGRNHTIMTEVIDALDNMSEGLQKMFRLL
jgi:dynactin complex subunit